MLTLPPLPRLASIRALAAFLGLALAAAPLRAEEPPPPLGESLSPLRLNTVGFLPHAPKIATVALASTAPTAFRVLDAATAAPVYAGLLGAPVRTAVTDTDETVRLADFSALHTQGRYVLEVAGLGRSAPFRIADDVWNAPFAAVIHGLTLWRCGSAVSVTSDAGTFAHAPCHLEDGWLDEVGGGHVRQDGTGGWHDAGDYNKYVVNAGVSVGFLLHAWEHYRAPLASLALQLPGNESANATPDYLDEIRCELEWLLKMQLPDGRVYHKLSAYNFRFWGPAEKDDSPRFFTPWGSTATADFAAMLAAAARIYRPHDAAFADRCLAAARLSWDYLVAHPANVEPNQHAFHTGGYGAKDETHRLWAAAELWVTTGDTAILHEFERRATGVGFSFHGPVWPDVRDLALGAYLLSPHTEGRDPALVARLTDSLLAAAARVVFTASAPANAYARPLGTDRSAWSWGANGTVAGQTYLLHLADRLSPDPRYRATALDALAHLFGRNWNARSYVTGLGALPPLHPHDRRGEPAWPGYLVGGGWPTGRHWVDDMANYRVNEIALNWNAALAYALAAFVDVIELSRDGTALSSGATDTLSASTAAGPLALTYRVTNRANAPLRLDALAVHSATGCTVELPDIATTLAPGASADLAVRLTPASAASGPWSATLALTYNGSPDQPRLWHLSAATR